MGLVTVVDTFEVHKFCLLKFYSINLIKRQKIIFADKFKAFFFPAQVFCLYFLLGCPTFCSLSNQLIFTFY